MYDCVSSISESNCCFNTCWEIFVFWYKYGSLVCESFSVHTLPFLRVTVFTSMTEPGMPSLSEGLSLGAFGVAPTVSDRCFIQLIVYQSLAAASETLMKSVDAKVKEV